MLTSFGTILLKPIVKYSIQIAQLGECSIEDLKVACSIPWSYISRNKKENNNNNKKIKMILCHEIGQHFAPGSSRAKAPQQKLKITQTTQEQMN